LDGRRLLVYNVRRVREGDAARGRTVVGVANSWSDFDPLLGKRVVLGKGVVNEET